MSQQYENFRENGWRCYHNDPAFPHDDTPNAQVISYFTQGEVYKQNLSSKQDITFDKVCCVKWARQRLNKTLQYKRTWYGDDDVYKFAALENYIDQCEKGGYTKCLLSWQEVYMIKEKTNKASNTNNTNKSKKK